MTCNLLSLQTEDRDQWHHLMKLAVDITSERLYIWIQGNQSFEKFFLMFQSALKAISDQGNILLS